MTSRDVGGTRFRVPVLPAVLAVTDAVLLLFALGIWLTQQVPFRDLTEAYLLGNVAIGTGFAVGGALITLQVRRNAVGWLMLVAGSLYLLAAAIGSLLYLRMEAGDLGGSTRVLAALFTTVWFPAIALFIPLAMQLFPTGRPINRFWSAYLVVSVVGGICLTISWVLGPDLYGGMGLDGPDTLLPDGPPDWLAAVLAIGTPLAVAMIAGGLLAPLFRLVRRPGEERMQVLWFAWAALVVLVVNLPSAFVTSPPPVPLLTIPLIPLAMTVAVLRYRLYGITLVLNRTFVYLALTLTLLAAYLAVVFGLNRLIESTGVRERAGHRRRRRRVLPGARGLQRLVDRLMFGAGADPYGVLADLGRRLQTPMTPDQVLPAIATSVAGALRLPYVHVRAGRPGEAAAADGRTGNARGPDDRVPAHPPR